MSKVKTRKEIKEEMDQLAVDLTETKKAYALEVEALKSELEASKAELATAQSSLKELAEEIEASAEAIASKDMEIKDLKEAKEEMEAGLLKAQSALADPSFADAAIVPAEINQKIEDAEADEQEAKAGVEKQKELTISESDFLALSPEDQNRFFRNGGKIKKS